MRRLVDEEGELNPHCHGDGQEDDLDPMAKMDLASVFGRSGRLIGVAGYGSR